MLIIFQSLFNKSKTLKLYSLIYWFWIKRQPKTCHDRHCLSNTNRMFTTIRSNYSYTNINVDAYTHLMQLSIFLITFWTNKNQALSWCIHRGKPYSNLGILSDIYVIAWLSIAKQLDNILPYANRIIISLIVLESFLHHCGVQYYTVHGSIHSRMQMMLLHNKLCKQCQYIKLHYTGSFKICYILSWLSWN